ncbi:hypothetical protein [Actibacterium sp. 188UL27-1]|uniref:hypothetical protein n=1 Tax=Actibacterium sp. 188UL27-1 TaxID=2786961 RepID=UPI00195C059A|nr:hypothetical protein [Actibacterium sp. 188UL27-1]MBM7068704.1 hypothetical protein [Actibacterium sp. 188UL27-1]
MADRLVLIPAGRTVGGRSDPVIAIYDVATTVLEVPSGYMSDRLGRRMTLIASAAFGVAGAVLLGVGGDDGDRGRGVVCGAAIAAVVRAAGDLAGGVRDADRPGTLFIAYLSASDVGEMPHGEVQSVLGWYVAIGSILFTGLWVTAEWAGIEPRHT